jgi:beta-lactamase regulating signal transducer with metallopeptidase domain
MVSARDFLFVLGSSSLWLTGSGLVLWLCLQSRLRLSPGTCAVASILVVLQGWIWIGIPVQVNLAWLPPQQVRSFANNAAASDAAQAMATQTSGQAPVLEPSSASEAQSKAHSHPQADSPSLASVGPIASAVEVGTVSWVPPLMWLAAGLGTIWLAGIVILIWRSVRGFVALSRMVQTLPDASGDWQGELLKQCRYLKIATPPVLKVGEVAAPLLVQTLRRACVVVPACLWESFDAEQRRSILLHELAHYRRGDVWRQLAMRLLILPHWFNPVAWWAARQYEAASEVACDAIACGGDLLAAISYSKVLLVLNESMRNEAFVDHRLGIRHAQALAISGWSLTERVRHILHPDSQKESHMSRFLILSAMIGLTVLAGIRIRAADESSTSEDKAAENEAAAEPGVILRRRTITEEFEKATPDKATPDKATPDNASPAKEIAESLLANGGFEEVQDGSSDPDSWFATRYPPTAGHHVLASSPVAHSGKRSVFVEVAESHPDRRVDYNWTAVAKGWKVGEIYELSGWIKTENAKGPGFLMAQCWSEDGKQALGYSERPCDVTGTTDWTRVSTLLRVPEGTASVRIRAGLTSKDNKGAKAWIDDISLVKVSRTANVGNKNRTAKNDLATPGLLIANGGFEEVEANSGDPEAWFGTRIPQTAGHFVLASSPVAHSGKRGVVVEIGDNHPDRQVAYNWTLLAQGWKAGETYELSGWVRTEDVKQPAFIMAQFWGAGEGKEKKMIGGATTQTTYPIKGTTDWTRVTTRLTVPEGTRELRIRAGLSSLDNRGAKAWLDDISLVKVAAN